jgi:DUF4097 and DUF4098 domain-containing protein YvlB
MSSRTILAAVAAAVLPAMLCAEQAVDAHKQAAANGRVEIENAAGSIRVIGWAREEVAVKGKLGRGAEGLQLTGGSQHTRIEIETSGDGHGVRSELEIHVPAASRVAIESFSADINVSEVSGDVRAESASGNVTISGAREVEAEAVAGRIEISGATSRVRAESVNGPVTVKGAGGDIEASTVNGLLSVSGAHFERLHLESVSGDIHFDGAVVAKGSLELNTVSGNVEAAFPASMAADFAISTFSGHIQNELGPPPRAKNRFTSEQGLEFNTGGGGARIEMESLSGDINLRKQAAGAAQKGTQH